MHHSRPLGIYHIIALSGLLLIIIPARAQTLSSQDADGTYNVMQLDSTSKDSVIRVFIHHSPDPADPAVLSLTAQDIDPDALFEWSIFDTLAQVFTPFLTESGSQASTVTDLEPACYRVHISSDSTDTTMTAWVYRNTPYLDVEKDENGKIKTYQAPCAFLWLKSEAWPDTLRYYDFSSASMKTITDDLSTEWTCDDPEYELFGATKYLNLTIPNDPPNSRPPTQDTWFTMTVTDRFGLTLTDEVLYESVHTRADFELLARESRFSDTWTEISNVDPDSLEAPLEVKFVNLSENGEEFYWNFIDSAKTGSVEGDTTFDVADTAVFIYFIPQNYYPSLISVSDAGCADSIKLIDPIYVVDSKLLIPNVFTPNGDDHNDVFMVSALSIKEFRITIFNRWGNLVYEHEQTGDKFDWEGWDGTLYGKGNVYCEPGVYFFIIEAIGWDREKYRSREERGFVYLFR